MISREPLFLFASDGLVEGQGSESYVERVARALASAQFGLKGEVVRVGGPRDTLRGLLNRMQATSHERQPDWVILMVGSIDAWFAWLSARSPIWWSWLRYVQLRTGQVVTSDVDQLASAYRALIDLALSVAKVRVLVCTVSPLGEDLSSPLNQQVARLNGAIRRAAVESQLPIADVWQAFVDELVGLPRPSGHLPAWIWSGPSDRRALHTSTPDELGRHRGLRLTYDGIHLNSRGADLSALTVLRALVSAAATE